MKKVVLLLVSLFGFSFYAMSGSDKPIQLTELPKQAQLFINKYFQGQKIALIKQDDDFLDKSYDVIFTNGDKLEFDRKGQWTEVDCEHSQVPKEILPNGIQKYLSQNYARVKVKTIERTDHKGYEVELSNGVELEFNRKFQVIDIDR